MLRIKLKQEERLGALWDGVNPGGLSEEVTLEQKLTK